MDLASLNLLLQPAGQAALADAAALLAEAPAAPAAQEANYLAHLARLQKHHTLAVARAALETALLRERARPKFERAAAMYFTREALEQASGERIARYRAARYAGLPAVADLGCGIGGDSLGLAARGDVLAIDRDPLRLRMARENLRAYGLASRATLVLADVREMAWAGLPAFFFDPARRSGGRRRFSVADYEPPLAAVTAWLQRAPAGGVKISPGVQLAELAGYDAEVEFISDGGELKECALWFGRLKTAERRATLLPGPHTLLADPGQARPGSGERPRLSRSAGEGGGPTARPALGPPEAYLYEPDPAVLRAGLVTTLAAQLGAHLLDPDIAYLAAPTLRPTPFARAYPIEAAMPFQLKRLRAALRERGVGQLTVKKRGSPLEPERLIRQLRLSGSASRTIFLTHVAGEPYVLIGAEAHT